LPDLIAVSILEYSAHRQCTLGQRPNQVDIEYGTRRRFQACTLRLVEVVEASHLQPTAIVIAYVEAVSLWRLL